MFRSRFFTAKYWFGAFWGKAGGGHVVPVRGIDLYGRDDTRISLAARDDASVTLQGRDDTQLDLFGSI